MALKRGRKADWATDPKTGSYEEGLYETKYKTGKYAGRIKCYYFKDSKGKHKTCGSDFHKAVQKFAIFKREHNIVITSPKIDSLKVTLTDANTINPDEFADSIINSLKSLSNGSVEISDLDISNDFWVIAERVIKANLPYAAKQLNIPELAYLHKVKPPIKSITLDELWNIYETNYDGRSKRNLISNIKPAWLEFRKCVGKSSVRDIDFDDISKYNEKVRQDKDKPSVTNQYRYVKNRFDAVKGVVKKSKDKIEVKDDCKKLIEHMEQLTYVKKEQEDILVIQRPNKVLTAKELSKLLKASENDLLIKCVSVRGSALWILA